MSKKQTITKLITPVPPSLKWTNLAIGLLLIMLQTILLYPLFLNGYSRFVENIEAAHLANAQYLLNHFSEEWNNLWYMGFPVSLTYPPVFPYLIATISYLSQISITHVYRILTAIFMILTPYAIYLFTFYLVKRKTTSFLASLFYILLPNIAYLFIPQIISHTLLAGFTPYRLIAFTQYGEGPHLASLFFIPLAAMYFIKSFRQPDVKNYVLASVFIALTLLTNLFGGISLLIILAIIVLGKMAIYLFNFNYRRLFIIGLLSYLLTAFVYNYDFIQSIFSSTYIHPENATNWPPFLTIFIAVLFLILPATLLIKNKMMGNDSNFKWFVVGLWTLTFLVIPIVYYHFGYSLISQPNRYLPELEIGFAILLGMLVTILWDIFEAKKNQPAMIKKIVAISFTFIALLLVSYSYISKPFYLIRPQSMSNSYEAEIADYLANKVDATTGERVYLTGTPAFWLNAFAEIPQIRGGADNAQPNPWWADAAYQINQGNDAKLAKSWLNIMNVRYILVNHPASGTHYVDYANYERLQDYSSVASFADGGFELLEVPDGNLSLFVQVNQTAHNYTPQIESKTDFNNINRFAEMLNSADLNLVKYQIISPSKYTLQTENLTAGDVIIFKMNYNPRWQAVDQFGHHLKIESIGPNFIKITPQTTGQVSINVYYQSNWIDYLGYTLTALTLIFIVIMLYHRRRKLID